ncbi:AraC family transcriptional regulator [Streptomyces sp. NPDC000594]|uniref:helix-turn-helix transcriptional regulator n=1 Tax=Streptomyces sp. NPDC000594 TaxID=3154261 RepID=UPI0033294B8E
MTETIARPPAQEPVDEDLITDDGHPTHVHDYHQFLHVPVGRIVVTARGTGHELSPSVGLWLPAGLPHSARFDPGSLVVSETFETDEHRLPYRDATVVNIGEAQRRPLLSRMGGDGPDDATLFAVLTAGPADRLPLPLPTSDAARAVAGELLRRPDDPRTADEWARGLYTSSTSLRRAFRTETGIAFSEWRTRLRLNRSLELLAQGQMVGAVATRVGFVSTNGYILAFRKHFGRTPGAYVRE